MKAVVLAEADQLNIMTTRHWVEMRSFQTHSE